MQWEEIYYYKKLDNGKAIRWAKDWLKGKLKLNQLSYKMIWFTKNYLKFKLMKNSPFNLMESQWAKDWPKWKLKLNHLSLVTRWFDSPKIWEIQLSNKMLSKKQSTLIHVVWKGKSKIKIKRALLNGSRD